MQASASGVSECAVVAVSACLHSRLRSNAVDLCYEEQNKLFFSQNFNCHIVALMSISKANGAKHEQDAWAWFLMTQEFNLIFVEQRPLRTQILLILSQENLLCSKNSHALHIC